MSESATWYSKKPYIHFDLPLFEKEAVNYASHPQRVVSHPFFPLLTYNLTTPRIKKCPPGSAKPFSKERKERTIAYPAHKDGYIFSYYKSLLERCYEEWLKSEDLGEVVTAFRKTAIGENNVTLAKKAFDFIEANPNCQIVVTDVESFFDKIDHEQLKNTWACFLGVNKLPADHYAVYKAITRYSVVERHKVYNLFGIRISGRLRGPNAPKRICTSRQFREKVVLRGLVDRSPGISNGIGIPQGTSLSPLLSNMYMADLDVAIHRWITTLGGKYWRYCDDILIVVPGKESPDILAELDQQLTLLNLKRSCPKTHKINSRDLSARKQLQYLGFTFNGSKAIVRSSSIHRYHRKLKKAVWAAKGRQNRESLASHQKAPFRQQALYNMYSELPKRGRKIRARKKHQKFSGNFTDYMKRSAKLMGSPRIERQRKKVLEKLRTAISKHKR